MAFPDEDLDVRIEAAFGADLSQPPATWTWTDLTRFPQSIPALGITAGDSRLLPSPISIRRGAAVGAAATQISSASVLLRNDDGALTPRLASSPYWPNVDTGTPARIRLRAGADPLIKDTFSRTVATGWGDAESGPGWGTVVPGNTSVAGNRGTFTFSAPSALEVGTDTFSALDFDVTFDAGVSAVASGIAHGVGPVLRLEYATPSLVWPTVEFMPSGQIQLKFFIYDGGYLSAGQTIVAGLTYTAGQMIRVKMQVVNDRIRGKAWLPAGTEPTAWTLDVLNPLPVRAGRAGIQAIIYAGSTNTYPVSVYVDNLTIERALTTRMEGYLSDVRPTFSPEGGGRTWSTVALDISGVGSRLEKNESPAYSPMRRSIQLAAVPPIAYWPLEDGEGATYGVSAFPGGPKMNVTGPATFGYASGVPAEQYLTRYGTRPLLSVATGARLTAAVPVSQVSTQWAVDITNQMYVPDVPAVTEIRIMEWHTPGGTHSRWAFVGTDTGYEVRAYHAATLAATNVISITGGSYGVMVTWEIDATQVGADIVVNLYVNSAFFDTGTLSSSDLGPISKIVVNPDRANTTASVTPSGLRFIVGHVRVSDDTGGTGTPYYYDNDRNHLLVRADLAWYQESAHKRIKRLCDEENVPFQVIGTAAQITPTPLGAQQDDSFTGLITAAAEAESGGLLYEDGFGYTYLPRSMRYNQGPAVVVDLGTYARSADTNPEDVLVPRLESRAANMWTVERTDGATGSYAAPASVRYRRGSIAQQVTLDVLRDTDTDDHASWRTHLAVDAVDADYPNVSVDLAANPDLIEGYLDCTIGSRVRRDNQPTIAGVGSIEQVVEGITETFGPRSWTAELACSPAKVWDVAVLDEVTLDTAGCVTAEALDATEAGVDVTTTSGRIWAPTSVVPSAVPFDILVGGEQMTVTNVSGTGTAQTLTVTRSVNGIVKTHASGVAVTLADPSYLGL